MKYSIIVATILSLAFITSTAVSKEYCYDSPLCVAELALEKGISFRFYELENYTCQNMLGDLEEQDNKAELAVLKYKGRGIDLRKDVNYDFSKLKYKIISENGGQPIVLARGNYNATIEGKSFQHNAEIEAYIVTVKENGSWKACGMKQ